MGIGGISLWQLLIILLIIVLLFGTTKLRTIGGDLGNAVKGFRKAIRDEEEGKSELQPEEPPALRDAEQRDTSRPKG
jgi:sec-independent protein translocase protein TatA